MGDSQEVSTSKSASPQVNELVGNLAGQVNTEIDKPAEAFNQSLYGGLGSTTQGGIEGLISGAQNPAFATGAQGALDIVSDVAAGNRMGEAAPGFATLRQGVSDDTIMEINNRFASYGQDGSGKHRESLGKGLGQALAGLDYQNYQNDIARLERNQQGLGAALNTTLAPSQIALGAGQLQDADTQATLLGEQDLHQRQQDAQLTRLGQGAGILGAAAGAGGQTVSEPTPPWWQQGIGLAAGLGGAALSGGYF